jgi:hypothetical protein
VASHHDHFFQVAFGQPEHAAPLLRTALPAPVADAIDWRTLTRQDPTQRGRRGRRTLCDLLFDLARLPASLREHLPSLTFVLDDLHDVPPATLRQRALSVFGLCALSALQYLPRAARDERAFAAFLDGWHDVQEQAAQLGDAAGGRDLFDALVDYVYATSGLSVPVVQRQLAHRFRDPAMKNKFVSTAQQIRNEGKAEGKVASLLRLITRRFGAPADAFVARLHNATDDDLDRWTDRILDAASLADVFAD